MKKKTVFIVLAPFLLLTGWLLGTGFGQESENAIVQVKLSAESLPPGMSVAKELWASTQQLLRTRLRIGFPLDALLNQTILYDSDQAKVNYMLPPGDGWLNLGYSKLIQMEGARNLILRKNGVIIQTAATSKELEDTLVHLLDPDPLQSLKIRIHRLPDNWVLNSERFLRDEELQALGQKTNERIQFAIAQEFMVNRKEIRVIYYYCDTEQAAEHVAQYHADTSKSMLKRLVRFLGSVVVVVDSQDSRLNENALALMNW